MQNPKLALMLLALLPMAASVVGSSFTSLNLTIVGQVSVTYQAYNITGHELRVTPDGGSVGSLFRFLGVPYAEPPVGDLRFAAPKPLNFSLSRSVDATVLPAAATCPNALASARNRSASEDCLYLSVRSPHLTGKLPVLALLADPQDAGGSANAGDALAASSDIVVVTAAYRAGALGYLGGDNAGLADQRLALQFVRDAIDRFGGDPAQVVLAGHGADAAAAVGMHAVGAAGDGGLVFQRVVMMSGSIASPLAWSQAPAEAARLATVFAERVGCAGGIAADSLQMLTCLRSVPLANLTMAEVLLVEDGDRFAPVFPPSGDDGASSLLFSRWSSGAFNGSLLIGAAADTGEAALRHVNWDALDHRAFKMLTDRLFRYFPRLHSNATAAGRNYLRLSLADWPYASYGSGVRPQLTRAVGDFAAVCPVWQAAANLTRAAGSRGVFVYSHDAADPTGEPVADARYLLGEPLLRPGDYSVGHRNLSRKMMEHLAAFVSGSAPGKDWRQTTTDAFEFMKFDVTPDGETAVAIPASGGYGFGPGRCPLLTGEMLLADGLRMSAADPAVSPPLPATPEAGAPVFKSIPGRRDTVLANYTVNIITFGAVYGATIRTEANVVMSQFLGIPYAKKPVGDLRFAAPQPLPPPVPGTIHVALSMPPLCMQQEQPSLKLPMSEDCLYLNLWTPQHISQSSSNLPVVVFLHGGFFGAGGIADPRWLGSQVLDHHKVVVITVSYRLGAFGFLALPGASGATNLGIRDQELALEWIAAGVNRFGGSTAKVTLMGVEAGAASVGYLMARPRPRFHRAVMLTGSPYLPYAVALAEQLRPLHANFTGPGYLNCSGSGQLLACLRALNASLINAKQADFLRDLQGDSSSGGWWPIGSVFSPVVDGDFIAADPLAAPPAGQMPLLLGTVDAPGNGLVTDLGNLTHADFLRLLDQSLGYFPRYPEPLTPNRREAARLRFTRFLHNGQRTDPAAEAQLLAMALGSRHFACPNWRFLAEAADRMMRVFSFVFAEDRRGTDNLRGASLFDDAFYAMGNPAVTSQPLGEGRANLSKLLMLSIVTFSDSGIPDDKWETYNSSSRRIRLLTSESTNHTYIQDYAVPGLECAFWNRTLPCVDTPNCIDDLLTPPPPMSTQPQPTTLETTGSSKEPPPTTPDTTGSSKEPPLTTPDTTGSSKETPPTTPDSTGSSNEPPPTTRSPEVGGGLSTLVLALIIVFSIVGAILLAAAAFLFHKFFWVNRIHPLKSAQEMPDSRVQRNQQPPGGQSAKQRSIPLSTRK